MKTITAILCVLSGIAPAAAGPVCPEGATLAGGCARPGIMDRLADLAAARAGPDLSDTGPVLILPAPDRALRGMSNGGEPRLILRTKAEKIQNERGD